MSLGQVQLAEAVRPRILIAEDQPSVLEALQLVLKSEGYLTTGAASPRAVLQALKSGPYDVLLLDLNYARDTTSGAEGLELLARVQEIDTTLPVVVMTAWGSIELAVEAMQRGARDFIQKPWENDRLLAVLRTQYEQGVQLRRERLAREQETADAREIQRRLLPEHIPQIPGYNLAVAWRPARDVGGDYFDLIEFDQARAGLCIADVAGKGMPAALLMSNLQAAVRAIATSSMAPAELCRRVNRIVCENAGHGRFTTFFYSLLDSPRRRLLYCNAGHNPPILVRNNGAVIRLTRGGAVLGEFAEWVYEQGEITLWPGDRIVFFTDGITEACDGNSEEFGEGRLAEALQKHRQLGSTELQHKLMETVEAHCGGQFHDDATLFVLAVESDQ